MKNEIMKNCRTTYLFALLLLASPFAQAKQVANTNQPPTAATNASPPPGRPPGGFGAANNAANDISDHKKMMELLHIDSLRRGRDGK